MELHLGITKSCLHSTHTCRSTMHTEPAHASIRCSCFNNGLIFQASVHSQTSEHQDATTKLAELRRQKDEMQIKVEAQVGGKESSIWVCHSCRRQCTPTHQSIGMLLPSRLNSGARKMRCRSGSGSSWVRILRVYRLDVPCWLSG